MFQETENLKEEYVPRQMLAFSLVFFFLIFGSGGTKAFLVSLKGMKAASTFAKQITLFGEDVLLNGRGHVCFPSPVFLWVASLKIVSNTILNEHSEPRLCIQDENHLVAEVLFKTGY